MCARCSWAITTASRSCRRRCVRARPTHVWGISRPTSTTSPTPTSARRAPATSTVGAWKNKTRPQRSRSQSNRSPTGSTRTFPPPIARPSRMAFLSGTKRTKKSVLRTRLWSSNKVTATSLIRRRRALLRCAGSRVTTFHSVRAGRAKSIREPAKFSMLTSR